MGPACFKASKPTNFSGIFTVVLFLSKKQKGEPGALILADLVDYGGLRAVLDDRDGAIEASDLKAYAAEIGLNMDQFTDCVTARRYRDRVNAEQHEGFERGLKGAPVFFVNGQPVIGPQRLSTFVDLIDPILAAKK